MFDVIHEPYYTFGGATPDFGGRMGYGSMRTQVVGERMPTSIPGTPTVIPTAMSVVEVPQYAAFDTRGYVGGGEYGGGFGFTGPFPTLTGIGMTSLAPDLQTWRRQKSVSGTYWNFVTPIKDTDRVVLGPRYTKSPYKGTFTPTGMGQTRLLLMFNDKTSTYTPPAAQGPDIRCRGWANFVYPAAPLYGFSRVLWESPEVAYGTAGRLLGIANRSGVWSFSTFSDDAATDSTRTDWMQMATVSGVLKMTMIGAYRTAGSTATSFYEAADGSAAAVSAASEGRLRYNVPTQTWQQSTNGTAWADIGGITGSGVANRLAYWSAASVLTSNAAFNVDTVEQTILIGGSTNRLTSAPFSGYKLGLEGTDHVGWWIYKSNEAVDRKLWSFFVNGINFYGVIHADNQVTNNAWLSVERGASASTSITLTTTSTGAILLRSEQVTLGNAPAVLVDTLNANVSPVTDASLDLGLVANRWRDLRLSGAVKSGTWNGADITFAFITPATAASKLLGRGSAAGAGDFEEITIGSGLTMTGTTLSATGGGGVTASGPPVAGQVAVWTSATDITGDTGLIYSTANDSLGVGPSVSVGTYETLSVIATETIPSGTNATWNGINFQASVATTTGTTNITTATGFNFINIGRPTVGGTALTITNSATLYISNSPLAGAGTTVTNAYAIWVDGGNIRGDGTIRMSTGTAALPTYTFDSDPDTGMYGGNGVDDIRFSTGGVDRLEITSTAITVLTTNLQILADPGAVTTPGYSFNGISTTGFVGGTGSVSLSLSGATRHSWNTTNYVHTPAAASSGNTTHYTLTGAAHTGQTAGADVIDVNFNLARTLQHATGAVALQRAFVIQAPTYSFVGASTMSLAYTFEITAAPTAGTNATITAKAAARIIGGLVLGSAALATTAVTGFLYIPTCAGTPTGTPEAHTGTVAMIYDSTNQKLYVYNGAWRSVTLA